MDELTEFRSEAVKRGELIGANNELQQMALDFQHAVGLYKYSYNFEWLGIPIIQYPQDIVALQEIIYLVRPDLVIETGVAHGGSLVLSASLLALLDLMDSKSNRTQSKFLVIGIDIEIRDHNRKNIESHPLAPHIKLIEGSSTDQDIINVVTNEARRFKRPLVLLDSNHSYDHVLKELHAYSNLVPVGSYIIVYDTVIEFSPPGYYGERPWEPGNSPLTAVKHFLSESDLFEVDNLVSNKLLISVAPNGFLKRIK